MFKYCVASVTMSISRTSVGYYAYIDNNNREMQLVDDWKGKYVIWFDTEEEALKHRRKSTDCVVKMATACIPKFSKETLKEFIEDYKGFDFEKGKVILVYGASPFICTDGWKDVINIYSDYYVKNYKNDEDTIVIVLSDE